jgi:putative effector of murein hydrolase
MLALFWLLADRLGIRSRSLRLLVVVLVIVVVSAAVPLCQNGWQGGSTGEETLACGFATAASALRVPLYHTRLQVFVRAGQPTAPIAKSDVSIGTSRSE